MRRKLLWFGLGWLVFVAVAIAFNLATAPKQYPEPRVTVTKCVADLQNGNEPQPTPCPLYVTGM